MHRRMRDQVEEVLSGRTDASSGGHLKECGECRDEIAAMRKQAELLRALRPPADIEPKAGFYARVMERIETQGAASIWSLFFESPFGRRIAVASMALALCLGVYLVSSEQTADQAIVVSEPAPGDIIPGPAIPGEDQPGLVLAGTSDPDTVLVNLVTYREQ